MSGTLLLTDFARRTTRQPRTAASFLLPTGCVLADRYRILSPLGCGGFGSVYYARCLNTDQHVAVKLVHRNASRRSLHFRREAALLARLRHPNIVRVLDVGCSARGAFLVFELLLGRSLADLLHRREHFGRRRTVHIALQILAALSVSHRHGVVHRDIKPANIFVCEKAASEHVTVIDFGLAKLLSNAEGAATRFTRPGDFVGTPAYMAPEQLRGAVVGPRADLYATGLVIAELLSGQRVYSQRNVVDLVQAKLRHAPEALGDRVQASPLCRVIQRALGAQPLKRYANAAAMAADLLRASGPYAPEPIAAGRATTVAPGPVAEPDARLDQAWFMQAASSG